MTGMTVKMRSGCPTGQGMMGGGQRGMMSKDIPSTSAK